jgi:hypothetical protein
LSKETLLNAFKSPGCGSACFDHGNSAAIQSIVKEASHQLGYRQMELFSANRHKIHHSFAIKIQFTCSSANCTNRDKKLPCLSLQIPLKTLNACLKKGACAKFICSFNERCYYSKHDISRRVGLFEVFRKLEFNLIRLIKQK